MKKLIKIFALTLVFVLSFAACGGEKVTLRENADSPENVGSVELETEEQVQITNGTPETFTEAEKNEPENLKIQNFKVPDGYAYEEVIIDENATRQKVKFTMENGAYFIVELYPEYAPVTCENFLKLVNEGYYDGLTFHRVVPGFMAQGGDPTRSGREDKADEIYGEFYINGHIKNTISHQRGVISMARTGVYDSASSQFFICYDDCSYSLDGAYAAFGIVTEGMEVVDSFLEIDRVLGYDDEISEPVTPIFIAKAEVIK